MRQPLFAICLLSMAAHGLHAQELSLLGGGVRIRETPERSFALSLDYQHQFDTHAALGLSYLNEGHPDKHHRDGISAQFWARTAPQAPGLVLAAGIGPYYYFDTASVGAGDPINRHGWGALYSLAATWQTQTPWFIQLRANRVHAHNNFGTSSLLLGVGYRLAPSTGSGQTTDAAASATELTLYAGQTIVNDFNAERSTATGIEVRRALGRHTDWSVTWLNEGNAHLIRRNALAAQLWLVHPFFDDRMMLGLGAGPYFTINRNHGSDTPAGERERLSGLLSLTAAYRLSPQWRLRMSLNRVITNHDRDADVLLIGAGFPF